MTQLTKREQIALEMFSLRGRLLLDESVNEIIEFSVSTTDKFLKHLAETEPVEKEMKGNKEDIHTVLNGSKFKDVAIGDLILIMDRADYSHLITIAKYFMPLWKIVMPVPSECKFPIYLERTADGDFYREKPDAKGAIYGFEHGDFKKLNPGYVGFTEEKPKQPEYPRPVVPSIYETKIVDKVMNPKNADSPDSRPMNAEEIADWVMRCYESGSTPSSLAYYINILVQYEVNKAKR